MEIIQNQKTRPTLLTVIGILSFIGLGYRFLTGIITATIGAVTSPLAPYLNNVFENEVDLSDVPDGMKSFVEGIFDAVTQFMANLTSIYLSVVLLSAIGLLGVIMMWQLRRAGFYLYAAARSLIAVVPFVFIGYNILSLMWFSASIVFGVVFIVMYGINLKEMT